jgi:hypothetical protein
LEWAFFCDKDAGNKMLDELDRLDRLDENALPSPFGGRVGDGGYKHQTPNKSLIFTSSFFI